MKKILSLLLVFLMLFSFTACAELMETAEKADEKISSVLNEAEDLAEEADSQLEGLGDDAESIAENADDEIENLITDAESIAEDIDETIFGSSEEITESTVELITLDEDGTYTSKEDVSLYLFLYGHLPNNFITKSEARELGWEGGSLEPYAPGMCIGGDYFGNYEGLLPTDRSYHECDIDTLGANSRGAKRIVFSDDGLIYYTDDHYESFELLYGEP